MDRLQDPSRKNSLVERRRAVGASIYRVAKLAGVKWETVREIERGNQVALQRTAEKIEGALQQLEEGKAG